MIRPHDIRHGTIYGMCNQLGFIFNGLETAEARGLKEVTIGCFNKDITNPSFISTDKIFDFSELPLKLKINYEKENTNKYTDFEMKFNFNEIFCKSFKFSHEIETFANEIFKILPKCSALIHSKLENDTFKLRDDNGGDKNAYEQDMINQYQKIIDILPDGNLIILANEIHPFWKNNPRCIFPQKKETYREINAAIEMCLGIKILNDLSVEFVRTSGSTFDHVMQYRIGINKTHVVYI